MITVSVRGSYIKFTATFSLDDGTPAAPISVTLTIAYWLSGQPQTATIPMSLAGSVATATWNPSGVDAVQSYWSVLAIIGSGLEIVQDGVLDLTANLANVG